MGKGGINYIPRADSAFSAWQHAFVAAASDGAAGLGLTPADIAALQAAQAQWDKCFDGHVAAAAAARAATSTKDEAPAGYESLIRPIVRRIQAGPGVTPAQRAALGIPVRSGGRAPSVAPTTAPVLHLSPAGRFTHRVEVRDSLSSRRRGLPRDVWAAEVRVLLLPAGESAPSEAEGMPLLALLTRASLNADFPPSGDPRTAWYAARWLGPRGQGGPWGPLAHATVAA